MGGSHLAISTVEGTSKSLPDTINVVTFLNGKIDTFNTGIIWNGEVPTNTKDLKPGTYTYTGYALYKDQKLEISVSVEVHAKTAQKATIGVVVDGVMTDTKNDTIVIAVNNGDPVKLPDTAYLDGEDVTGIIWDTSKLPNPISSENGEYTVKGAAAGLPVYAKISVFAVPTAQTPETTVEPTPEATVEVPEATPAQPGKTSPEGTEDATKPGSSDGQNGSKAGKQEALAATGSDAASLIAIAAAMMMAGTGATFIKRNRKNS